MKLLELAGTFTGRRPHRKSGRRRPQMMEGLEQRQLLSAAIGTVVHFAPLSSSTYGDAVTFSVTVTNTSNDPSVATGTVTFYDGAVKLGNAVTLTAGAASFTTGAFLTAGTHAIRAVYSGDTGAHAHAASSARVTETIARKEIRIDGITAADKIYDGTTAAAIDLGKITVEGVLEIDMTKLAISLTGARGTFASKNAGNNINVTFGGIVLTGTAARNYSVVATSATATIAKKTVTVTGVTANNRVYDGTDDATLNITRARLSGIVAGDLATAKLDPATATGTFASGDVGTGIAIDTVDLVLKGTAKDNYTFVKPGGLTANITPKTLTITGVTATSRDYDGTTDADINGGALSGVVGADDVDLEVVGVTGTFATKNAGTNISVTVGGYAISGADIGNYVLAQPTGIKANITRKTITVTADANTKVYNGTTAGTLDTTSAVFNALVAGDAGKVAVAPSAGTFASANVGNGIVFTASNLRLVGTAAANYTLNIAGSTVTGDITPKVLTLTGVTAANMVYTGGTALAQDHLNGLTTARLVGVLAADLAGVTLDRTTGTGTFADKNVGNNKTLTLGGFTLTGAKAANYTVAMTIRGNITPAALTVTGITVVDGTKEYDGTKRAALNTSSPVLSAAIGADVVSLVTTGAIGTFDNANVGTNKTVTIGGLTLTGADAGNYTVSSAATTADITRKDLTVKGIVVDNRVYNGADDVSATISTAGAYYSGLVFSDLGKVSLTITNASAEFADGNAGNGKALTFDGITLGGTAAGNYNLVIVATANITPIALTVSGITATSRTYDATTTVVCDPSGATLSAGVLAGDTVALDATGATSGTMVDANVGTGKTVTVDGLVLTGAQAANYTVSGTTTVNITAAALTVSGVTAEDKDYDGTTAATLGGTPTFTGLQGSDTFALSNLTGTFASKDAGTNIAVTLALSGPGSSNYTFTTQAGLTADITPLAVTVSGLTAADKVYNGTASATLNGTATFTGVLAGDTLTIASGAFANKTVGTDKAVTLTLGGASASNYTLTQPGLTADITPVTVTISGVTADDKVYNGTTVATLTGVAAFANKVAGDTLTAVGTFDSKNVGTDRVVTLSLGGADAANYVVSSSQATLAADITRKDVTISGLTVDAKVYDGTTDAQFSGTATFDGKVAGDVLTVSGAFVNADAGTDKSVPLTLGGADAANYTITQESAVAGNITPKSITVTGVTVANKVHDGTTTAVLSGTPVFTGLLGSDAFVLANLTGTFVSPNVGTDVTVNLTLSSGTNNTNYAITTTLTADIT